MTARTETEEEQLVISPSQVPASLDKMSVDEYLATEEFPSLEELRELDTDSVEEFKPNITIVPDKPKESEPVTLDTLLSKADDIILKSGVKTETPFPITYEAAKELFWHILKAQIKDIVIDGNLKEVLPNLIKYFIGNPESTIPLHKGIYLYGDVGVGKTRLMECFSVFTQTLSYKYFKVDNVKDISFRVKRQKDTALLDQYMNGNWCVDDLFADQEKSKIYGNTTDVSSILIEQFYIHGWRRGKKIHCTSNIIPAEISKQVDDKRFVDRVIEMMTPVYLEGNSKRK